MGSSTDESNAPGLVLIDYWFMGSWHFEKAGRYYERLLQNGDLISRCLSKTLQAKKKINL